MPEDLKPGKTAPRSGQYEIVGPRGGGTGVERTVTRGEPMPPPPEPGQHAPKRRQLHLTTENTECLGHQFSP